MGYFLLEHELLAISKYAYLIPFAFFHRSYVGVASVPEYHCLVLEEESVGTADALAYLDISKDVHKLE